MKELEDLPAFPAFLRNFQTAFIGFVAARSGVYRPFIRYLRSQPFRCTEMFDLCSGSGEPAIKIFRESGCFDRLALSDRFPLPGTIIGSDIIYRNESLDVRSMKFLPGACYTMFNAFHHFTDAEKRVIVRRMHEAGARGFFVELLAPGPGSFLKVFFLSTVGNIFLAPFVRPFSTRRIFFTYILPLNIGTILFDGIVSVFRSRSVKAYRKLFADFGFVRVIRLTGGIHPLTVIHILPGT